MAKFCHIRSHCRRPVIEVVPHAVNFGVVFLFPGWQRQELFGHAGVHPVAVDGDVLSGKEDLVLAVQRQARLRLHVEAVLEAAWNHEEHF